MKIKTLLIIILVIILVSCAPAATSEPTKMTNSTATLTPIPPTATVTLTSIPTLESLSNVPPPDTKLIESAIKPFVSAMKMAEIELDSNTLASELKYQEVTDVTGKPFIVATVFVNPDPTSPGESLEGNYPILIREYGGIWKIPTPDSSIKIIKGNETFAGASLGGSDIVVPEKIDSFISGQFGAVTLEGWHWKYYEPRNGEINKDYAEWDKWMKERYKDELFTGHPLYYPEVNPDWIQSMSDDDLLATLEQHIKSIVNNNSEINRWVVVNEPNEPFFSDICYKRFGNEIYLMMFQWAHEANPDAILILNDYNNDHQKNSENDYGNNTSKIKDILELLKSDKELFSKVHIGMQMHYTANKYPDISSILETIKQYEVPVDITELTVTPSSSDVSFQQAEVYRIIGEVVENSPQVQSITFWGIGESQLNKDITFFSGQQKKLAYYTFLAGLFNLTKAETVK